MVSSLIGGTPALVFADDPKIGTNAGFQIASPDMPFVGRVFTFASAPGEDFNDQQGDPDYALASLEIVAVAPVPVPAGAILLGSALAGFAGIARRRKSSRG